MEKYLPANTVLINKKINVKLRLYSNYLGILFNLAF